MNYFDFFEIPFSLSVDERLLKEKFYANSKKFHPDFFTLDNQANQDEALEKSTINNKAFNTLKDFESRLHHILTIKNVLEAEGKNKLPQEFLLEMMDINEAVMELQFDFDMMQFDTINLQIDQLKASLKESIHEIIPKIGQELTAEDYTALKNYYLKSKYLSRLTENINKLKP